MPTLRFEYRRILETLSQHGVRYVLIGGVCAAVHGAPVTTFDVDVLYDLEDDNVDRIMAALEAMEAYHREPGSRRLPPSREAIVRGGPALMATCYGALDLLGILAGDRRYADVLPHTLELEFTDGLPVCTLDLKTLIVVKRATGRLKDLAVLPILEAALREQTGLDS